MSQFLIGNLQTFKDFDGVLTAVEFQFLIGNLQTIEYALFSPVASVFQFLIGNLQTYSFNILQIEFIYVSIPYR